MNKALSAVQLSGIVAIRDELLKMDKPLRLESGEPAFETPDHIKEAAVKALRDNLTHYVNSQGIVPLREALSEKLAGENRVTANPNEIIMTNGGMHGLFIVLSSIAGAGDEVIIPTPNWTAVQWIIQLTGAQPCHVPLHEKLGFRFDMDELKRSITPRTKVIVVNSPHNPTGGMLTESDFRAILQIADEHGLYVVTDEAYEHIVYDNNKHITPLALLDEFPRLREKVIGVFTYSKSYAMTGWRLGYVVTYNEELMLNLKKLVLYSANGINSITQWAGIAALTGPQDFITEMRTTFQANRDRLLEGIAKSTNLRADFIPKGAFYLFPKLNHEWEGYKGRRDEWGFSQYLIQEGKLGCTPGTIFGPGGKGFMRFSYACSPEMVDAAAQFLARS
jgi:aspartate aminotransferase